MSIGFSPIAAAPIGAPASTVASVTLAAAACSQANACTVGAAVVVVPAVTLAAAGCSQANACTVGAAVVVVPAVTLAAAACSQANTCTVGVVTVVSGIALGAANCAQVNTCTVGVVAISLARVKIFGHYSSQDALTARFGAAVLVQLTNASDYSATAVDGNVLAAAIADVDALIDAKLAARYTLPIATLPLVLRNLACDLVRARLAADTMTDRMAERERAGLKLLDEIAAGKVQLGLDRAALETPASDGPTVVAGNPGRVFTPSGLADYHF